MVCSHKCPRARRINQTLPYQPITTEVQCIRFSLDPPSLRGVGGVRPAYYQQLYQIHEPDSSPYFVLVGSKTFTVLHPIWYLDYLRGLAEQQTSVVCATGC